MQNVSSISCAYKFGDDYRVQVIIKYGNNCYFLLHMVCSRLHHHFFFFFVCFQFLVQFFFYFLRTEMQLNSQMDQFLSGILCVFFFHHLQINKKERNKNKTLVFQYFTVYTRSCQPKSTLHIRELCLDIKNYYNFFSPVFFV